jgi:GDPmannose 4,6-dehydratase
MKRAIITGANGQDGFFLAELLRHYQIEPVLVPSSGVVSIVDTYAVNRLVEDTRPDYVFHLAAKSTVEHAAARQNHYLLANGTLNILQAVKDYAPECCVFLTGSAYQFRNDGNPIKETDPWETRSVYCAARGYSNLLARAYRHMGLHVYFGYFFHHDSPRRHARHISQRIATAAREGKEVEIGNAEVVKEWTWAGDTVEAVWSLVNQDKIWEANIGTGIGHSIMEFAEACFAVKGLNAKNFVRPRADFEPEYSRLTCDPERIYSTGWRPRRNLEYIAEQMVTWKP